MGAFGQPIIGAMADTQRTGLVSYKAHDHVPYCACGLIVERRIHLVEQQYLRLRYKDPQKCHTGSLPAGELRGIARKSHLKFCILEALL